MDPSGEKISGKVLVCAYIVGVTLAAGTEFAVIFLRGPGIYVSTL